MTRDDLHPVIARMVTATPIPPGTEIDLTPRPSLFGAPVAKRVRAKVEHRCACGAVIPRRIGRPRKVCDGCDTADAAHSRELKRQWAARRARQRQAAA